MSAVIPIVPAPASKPLHALLSPSGAERWMTCIGSIALCRGLPDSSNEYSDEGTCAHAIAALCLTEGEPATEYIGRVIEMPRRDGEELRTYEFREDMAAPTQVYVDLVNTLAKDNESHVEVELPIGHLTGEEGATGTGDSVIITADLEEIIVTDLKFGMGVEVDVKENKQLMIYGLAALEKYDLLGTVKRLRLIISQPRVSVKPSEWDITVEALRDFAYEVGFRASEALDIYNGVMGPGPVGLRPSEKACKFCKAAKASICPALDDFVVDAVGADYDVILDTPMEQLIPPASTDAETLALVAKKFRAIDLIEDWCKGVRARGEGLLFEMNNSPEAQAALGIKIVQGKLGDRSYTDEDAVEKLYKSFRLKQEEMYSFKLKSPTQMEKVIAAKKKKTWWAKVTALVGRSPGKPSVAKLSDKRPALDLKPKADDFDVIADEPALEDLG